MSKKFYSKYKSVLLATQFTKENFLKKTVNDSTHSNAMMTTKQSSVNKSKFLKQKQKLANSSCLKILSKTNAILPNIIANTTYNKEKMIDNPNLSMFYRKIDNYSAPKNLKNVTILKGVDQQIYHKLKLNLVNNPTFSKIM